MAENLPLPGLWPGTSPGCPHGLCPECLLRQGMESQGASPLVGGDSGLTDDAGNLTPPGFRPIPKAGFGIGPYRLLQADWRRGNGRCLHGRARKAGSPPGCSQDHQAGDG